MKEAGTMQSKKKKFKFKNPNAYFLIMIIILLATIATWIIPAGQYDRVIDETSGKEVVDPESFRYIEKTPVGIFDTLKAIPEGMILSAGIISFVFLTSGAVAVVKSTGAIDAGIIKVVEKLKVKDLPLLIIMIVIFSLWGSLLGASRELIPFIPLGVTLANSLGYDRVVGFHIVRTSAWVGFAATTINPRVVGVAQEMAGLPLLSGLSYRIIVFIVFMLISTAFFLRYAKKVKEDPRNSILYGYEGEMDPEQFKVDEEFSKFTTRHKLVLILFALNIVVLVYGTAKLGWGTNEMGALYLGTAIICGLVGGLDPQSIGREFSKGMSFVTSGLLIAGFTRAIAVILEQGQILDTIIYALSQPLSHVSGAVTAIGMFVLYSIITFFIGSASGRAAATLPIFIPLSDILGITRQTTVLAFVLGGGITNMLWPNMIYVISFADIPYDRWFKHILKLVMYLMVAGAVAIALAYYMNYGPF